MSTRGPALALLLIGGCRGGGVTAVPPTLDVTEVADGGGVVATFDQLLDGGVAFGSDPVLIPAQITLSLADVGGGGLSLSSITTLPDGGPFSIVGTLPTQAGDPGSPVVIQFTPPQQQSYQGQLVIASDDPKRPVVILPLTGVGSTEGQLTVSPNPVVFGQVGQGQTQTATLTLSSVGSAPLGVSGVAFGPGTDPAYGFVSSAKTPFSLSNVAGSNTLPLTLSFSPTPETAASPPGTVVITSSDPSGPKTVTLQATTVLAPVAAINAPSASAIGAQITLDGTPSSDPNQPALLPLTYQWALLLKPLGSAAQISNLTASQPTITLDVAGPYAVSLDVTNSAGIVDVHPAIAHLQAKPLDDLYVEMVWDNAPIDMDLHFLGAGATLNGPGDCNAYSPDAGFACVPSSDHLLGPGPEWVSLAAPPAETYTVECVLLAAHNATSLATNVTVRIYEYGVLSSQLTQSLDAVGQVWTAATIAWPSGTITPSTLVSP